MPSSCPTARVSGWKRLPPRWGVHLLFFPEVRLSLLFIFFYLEFLNICYCLNVHFSVYCWCWHFSSILSVVLNSLMNCSYGGILCPLYVLSLKLVKVFYALLKLDFLIFKYVVKIHFSLLFYFSKMACVVTVFC